MVSSLVEDLRTRIEPASAEHVQAARDRQARLTKPPGSLGHLEDVAIRLAGIQRRDRPTTDGRRIVVFAADHGVSAEGVSPYPSEVTGQMVLNFLAGGAAINAFAESAGAEVVVVDAGVAHLPAVASTSVELVRSPVARGTRNLAREPAMSEAELREALALGAGQARRAAQADIALVGLGEMGIGNTTAASAITAVLTGRSVESVTGRGTGLDAAGLTSKVEVIRRALALHEAAATDPLHVLRSLGGLEIAALTGFCLAAAAERLAILVDGFITTAAFALAFAIQPLVKDYAFFSHLSSEPGHQALLDYLEAEPLLDLGLRLGEGTGAALAMSLLLAGVTAHNQMATFESAGVSDRSAE